MRNIFLSFTFLLVVLGFVLIGTTCTIGLGASVDTEAPTIEITYPPISATIRDTFTLYGTWNDDQGVTSVRVSVINAKTKETVLEETSATIDSKNKTWQLELDSTYFNDGNYQITAYAMDGASHKSGDSNRSFDIDNTPPVFIISNPGVIKSSGKAASAYGSTLSIEGTIADEHTIPKMQISVYKADGSLIETFEESDISTAGGTSVTFANSYKGSDDNYYKMYSEEGDETQNFYCTVELYDSAYIYASPSTGTATTSIGNSTSQLYLYDDIFTELLSKNGGLALDATSLMNIINGNSTLETSVQTTVKNLLTQKVVDSSTSNDYLAFSLNPNANPTYTVNGYDVDISNESWASTQDIHQLSGGGTISVSYSYGLNETLIQPYGDSEKGTPSLKVWMKKIGTEMTETTALSDLTDLQAAVKILENNSITFEEGSTTADSDWLLIYDYAKQNQKSSSSATGTVSVTIPSGKIDGGAYYLFGVTGCDLDNMYFSQKATYLFQGTVNGYSPTVKITIPESNSTYTNNAGMSFSGSATLAEDENLYVKEIEATFKYGVTGDKSTSYNLKYYIEKVSENNSDTFTVLKVSKDSEGNEITETLTGDEPLIFYPTTIYETDENGNKTENIVHSAGYFAFDVSKIDNYSELKKGLASGKEYTYSLSITATSSSEQSATDVRNIYVDTVAPIFDDENSSVGGKNTAKTVNSTWFGSENLSVIGYLTEAGSGVSNVYYWLDSDSINIEDENKGTLTANYDKESKSYKYKSTIGGFSEQTKPHSLVLIGIDKAGNQTSPKSYSIKVDTIYPTITPKYYTMESGINGDASGNVLTNKENDVVVYGLVSDTASGVGSVKITNASGAEIATVTYSTTATTVTTGEGETSVDTNLTWFESQSFADYDSSLATSYTAWKAVISKENISNGDVKYIATDTAGNSITNRMFTFSVDQAPPTVAYNDLTDADASSDGTQVNGKITLSGRANDTNGMNSITKIQYKIGNSGTWTTISDGINTSLTSAYSWTSNEIDTSTLFPESKTAAETVYFRAIALDAAGNYSDESDSGIEVSVDQNSDRPVIRISTLDADAAIISSQNVMGTISDDDGITKFEYSKDNGTTWTEIEVTSGSWKIENLDAGTYSLTFRVTDKVGTVFTTNQTTGTFATYDRPYLTLAKDTEKKDNASTLTFSVDLNAPEIKTLKLAATNEKTAPSTTDASGNEQLSSAWKDSTESMVNFGKVNHYLYAYIKANEDVAVHSTGAEDITLKIGSSSVDVSSLISRTPTASVNGDLIYIVGPIDISNITGAEGTVTVSVTVKDASGRESGATQNIYVDEGAPEVSITSPNADVSTNSTTATNGVSTTTEAITGKYTIKGRVADTSGIAKFKYLIPTQAQISNEVTSSTAGWTSVKSLSDEKIDAYENYLTSSNWMIDFTSSGFETDVVSTVSTTTEHGNSLIYYATAKSDGKLVYAEEISGSTNVYVPLYFYVEDATGNGEIVKNKILVNPKGGIPTIEIITPDNLAKTGGNLNFQGTASDDEKVDKVVLTKLQFSATEATDQASADAISDWKDVSADILKTDGVVTKAHADSSGTIDGINDDGTITADGTNSWKIAINTSKITDTQLSGLGISELKTVRATIVSYDENGTPSNYDVSTFKAPDISSDSGETTTSYVRRTIFVDKNAPKLVTTQLVQFADGTTVSATETPSVIRTYSAGMYISHNTGNGNWYLKGVVEDDASVTGISITTGSKDYIQLEDKVGTDTIGETPATPANIIYDGLNTKTFTFLIPIDTSDEGQFYPTIEMWDGQHTDVTSNVSFFVDNDAPSLYTTSNEKNPTLAHADTLRLTSNGLNVDTTNVVENSDGAYSFGDTAVEERSGLDFIAVYFKKAANDTFKTANRVYSPLFSSSNVVEVEDSKTTDSVYINSEGLPALAKNVTRSDATHISYSGLGSNGFIKPYTVVKMAGSYIRITGITGDEATLASEVDTNVTECEFIYAQIVDHAVSEGLPSSRGGEISNDDGDGFVETLKQTGSSYKWSASVYSDNIPDGPAEIHVVAFDAAGNYNAGYVKTSIANNRPRISKVLLATDLNGNGKFDFYNSNDSMLNDLSDDDTVQNGSQFGEFVFYSTLKVSDSDAKGVEQSKVTLNAPKVFNVKKDLLVLPEFVGGNGALKYAYSLDNKTALDSYVTGSDGSLYSLKNTVDDLQLADKTLTDGTETIQKVASLVQSTTVSESDTALKYGGVVLTMNATTHKDLDDGKERYLAFTFWDNTYETTQGTDSLWATVNIPAYIDVVDNKVPESTITPFWWESADDYKSSFVYDSDGNAQGHISNITDTDRLKGTKPGVSGKVYINGSSYDETRLGEIHVVKPDGTVGGTDDVKIIWRALKDGSSTEYEWKTADGAEIRSEEEPSQDGHTITWRYQIDMTSYGVATDKVVKTYAVDAQTNTETVAETQTTTKEKTPYYKMDFVPYIKSIYTTTIGSANRSRLGKFPVRAGEQMTIEGMNFASGAKYTVSFYKSGTDGKPSTTVAETIANADVTKVSDGVIKVKAPNYSRWVTVTVDGVPTPNNDVTTVNDIPGCDIESGYVSGSYRLDETKYTDNGLAKSNKNGTDFWTNNRYIDAWEVNTTFPGSINPHSGVVKKIRESDTYNKNVGIRGSSSDMENKSDMSDHYMGLISSDDMRLYLYDNTNKNQTLQQDNTSAFTSPVDTVDMVVLGGVPYYVLQTNYVGNVNANCWGPGLILSRDGFIYVKGTFETTTTLSESKYPWIIEKQGTTISATERNSENGYDSVLYQFKNPRIAGWHTDTPIEADKTPYTSNGGVSDKNRPRLDYVYVTYYDSYAKCLKFAAYRSGTGIVNGKITTPVHQSAWGDVSSDGDQELIAEIRSANGNMTTGATVVAGNDTTTNNPTTFNEKAGEWSDIVVDTTATSTDGPIPVIVYYNETNKCLEVARGNSKFPKSKNYVDSTNTTAADSSLSGADAWTKTLEIRPTGSSADFGRYVSAAIDSSGNLHVAAQDATHSTLYYLYLTKQSTGKYEVSKSVLLDAASGAGLWTDIELTNPSGTTLAEIVPVVSYINSSYTGTTQGIKIAYVSGGSENNIEFDAATDPAVWSAGNQRTSVMADVYEGAGTTSKAKVGVGFNSDMLAIDFLRGEE